MPPSRLPRAFTAIALLASVTGCAATAPALPVIARAHSTASIDKRTLLSDEALAETVDPARPGCSGAVGVLGEVVWAGAAGIADLTTGAPVTTATRFDMASVAKQFTATAILMLQRDGALSLADPVGDHIERLPAWGRTVTLENLMHHTSRIRDYWVVLADDGIGFSDPADHATILDAIRRLPRLEPGAGYSYSNSNYVLLAEIVHRVSGHSLPEFLTQRIFAPLGLAMDPTPTLVAPDVALSYDADDGFQPPGWGAFGAYGIYATPSELARWGDQYRAGDIIKDDFAEGAADQGTGEYYGAGIDLEPDGRLAHNGRQGGHITTFAVSQDRRTTIVVMCNGHSANRFGLTDALWELWDAPAGRDG